MTNKASRTQKHVRFNKQVPTAPKKRKKAAQRQPEELSPYVSDLSKTPSLKRADKVKLKKKIWIFFAIFVVAAADQALPEIRETLGFVSSKAPNMVSEFSGLLQQVEELFNHKKSAVLLMDTVGYTEPSHLHEPAIHLKSGTPLIVHELNEGWAHISIETNSDLYWVGSTSLILDQ